MADDISLVIKVDDKGVVNRVSLKLQRQLR
jgi:hypothetical protein